MGPKFSITLIFIMLVLFVGHPSAAKFSFMVSLVYVSIWLVFT